MHLPAMADHTNCRVQWHDIAIMSRVEKLGTYKNQAERLALARCLSVPDGADHASKHQRHSEPTETV